MKIRRPLDGPLGWAVQIAAGLHRRALRNLVRSTTKKGKSLMSAAITQRVRAVQPGRPQGPRLRVLPILGQSSDQPSYKLLDGETLARIRVTEVSDAGSVPELVVENQLDVRVF